MREAKKELRSYNRTSFKLFALAVVVTIVLDYVGISVQELTNYADGILKKTHENISMFLIWAWPILTMVKEQVDDWRKSLHARDIEIARIGAGQDNRQVRE